MVVPLKNLFLLALMLLAAGMATSLRPTANLADGRPAIDLRAMVPSTFGDWREHVSHSAQIVDPQTRQMLDTIYSQTLTRTYVDRDGYPIMLSIAYGKNQSDALQMHKPDICYPAQGFMVLDKQSFPLNLADRRVWATHLIANLGQRHEPITYWTVVGDHITQNGISKKLTEMRYTLNGRIPDGMLVRLSSIDTDSENGFAIQARFAAQLVEAIEPIYRSRFAGSLSLN